jgi:hypothetical protein
MSAILSPETVMASAIIISARQTHEPILIEGISGLFAKLRAEKVEEVGQVALRRVPHGLYSEDVEAFFGRLLAGGFAEARSPLRVNDHGLRLCQELIDEEGQSHPAALAKVAKVLGFDLALLMNPGDQPKQA